MPYRDVHLLACGTIASGLEQLGFMKSDVDETVSVGAHALFFHCGTGHMMGLDVHDWRTWARTGLALRAP